MDKPSPQEVRPARRAHLHQVSIGEDQFITLSDGRKIAIRLLGPEWGVPVLMFPGNPGSRLFPLPTSQDLYEIGIRLIAMDRAGFGDSDPNPGLTVASNAYDAKEVVDNLNIKRFGVMARSGGVPAALACAALLGSSVTCTVAMAGLAPPEATINWLEGMTKDNQKGHTSARENHAELSKTMKERAANLKKDAFSLIEILYPDLKTDDRLTLAICGMADAIASGHAHGIADGQGWIDHTISLNKPWGFDVTSISTKMTNSGSSLVLWHGDEDPFATIAHSRWLHRNIPNSQLIEASGKSHFSLLYFAVDALRHIRNIHIGDQRAKFFDLLAQQRNQDFFGPYVDLNQPVTDKQFAEAMQPYATSLKDMRKTNTLEEKQKEAIILRRILGDHPQDSSVAKEILTSTDDQLSAKYPALWEQASLFS